MAKKEKIWALLVHLSKHMWSTRYETLPFDDDFWTYILEESVKAGLNTIVLDIGDGIQFASHPEIAMNGAWSRKRVRQEVKRCREMGITLIPKLNFSTGHDQWLGEYHRMTSSNVYYKLVNDLIKEVYNLFDKPEYIHLGMDEETARHAAGRDLAVYRQKELYWHDLNFLLDCVADTGARPWIWSCPLFRHPEEYRAHVGVKDAVISPWYYHAIKEENWTPISSWQDYIDYYAKEPYKSMNLTYVEQDPYNTMWRREALPALEEGFEYIPCASTCYNVERNTSDIVEYFKTNAPDDQILGYMTAPWATTLPTEYSKHHIDTSLRLMKEAKEAFYK